MARRCVFCGTAGSLTKEHVFPQWISRAANLPVGYVFSHNLGDGSSRTTKVIDLQVRVVCGSCNSGWMADLEDRAKPRLLPLIRGEEIELQDVDLDLIAVWTVKTALMAALATRIHRDVVTNQMAAVLYGGRTIPPCTGVWLGYERAEPDSNVAIKSDPWLRRGQSRSFDFIFYDWKVAIGSVILRAAIFPEEIWRHERTFVLGDAPGWLSIGHGRSVESALWPPATSVTFG